MDDLISRQAAIDALDGEIEITGRTNAEAVIGYVRLVKDRLERLPSAQPQRIKGRWERKESDLSWWYECSECGESPLFDPYENEVLTRFCPWCGAEMRQQEEQG